MTISRCELIEPDKLQYQFVSANDPDTIGVEVMLDGKFLIDVSMDPTGRISVIFDQNGGSMEFELGSLRQVLGRCESDLTEWREKLIEPGKIWSSES